MTRVVVIGAGHNGLVSAVVLARQGYDVTVVEQADQPGGCIWTETDQTGIRRERGAVDHGGVYELAQQLGLHEYGLAYHEHPTMAGFLVDGQTRDFPVSSVQAAAGFGKEQESYLQFVELSQSLFGMMGQFDPAPTLTQLAETLSHLRGGDDLFRMLIGSADSVLENTFTDPHLRASLALYAAHGQVPPIVPGSGMYAMLLAAGHDAPAVRPIGGSASLIDALVAALTDAGGTVILGDGVTLINTSSDRPVVHLTSGERLVADRVVSSIDIRRLTPMLSEAPSSLVKSASQVVSGRLNVSELTITLTSTKQLDIPVMAPDPDAIWFVQEGLGDLKRGFGEIIAGHQPKSPWSMLAKVHQQEGVSGTGLWLSSVVPLRPAVGDWDAASEEQAAQRVLDTVSAQIGVDLAAASDEVVVSGPSVWSSRIGGDGNPNHIDQTLDQMFGWRPPHIAGARSPIPWLYLAGAGTASGGGLSGASGQAAANALIADLDGGRKRTGLTAALTSEVAGLVAAFRSYRSMRKRSHR